MGVYNGEPIGSRKNGNETKKRSNPHTYLDNVKQLPLIDILKIQVAPTGFEPMTAAIPVQCSTSLDMKQNNSEQVNLSC